MMRKNKYFIAGGVGLAVLLLAGSGGWAWQRSHRGDKAVQLTAATESASQSAGAQTDANGQYTISPTPAASGPVISGGSAGQSGSSASVSGSGSASGGTVAGAATEISKLLDPTTFAQYDKYKDAQSASYIDLQAGTGPALSAGHQAAVYYRGWLTNGQLFDQSKAGSDGQLQAFAFTEGQHQVISGWEQALDGMKTGGVRLLIVPPAVGYGAQAQNGIPANSVLVFQVQLAAVQ